MWNAEWSPAAAWAIRSESGDIVGSAGLPSLPVGVVTDMTQKVGQTLSTLSEAAELHRCFV